MDPRIVRGSTRVRGPMEPMTGTAAFEPARGHPRRPGRRFGATVNIPFKKIRPGTDKPGTGARPVVPERNIALKLLSDSYSRRRAARGEGGFTLVELLVVIVILGILAAIVVFAVTGITNKGQTSACNTDAKTVQAAEEAAYASVSGGATASYLPMSSLVSSGFLHSASTLWSVSAGQSTYSLTGIGNCNGQSAP